MEIYNRFYYQSHCGTDYSEREVWERNFAWIADNIVSIFRPNTVLDVGCAYGYLVEALRDRGVNAYGIDISKHAISQVREDMRQFCNAQDILEDLPNEFPQKYDLVITIEVLEHIYQEYTDNVIAKLCTYGDIIVFSSSSDDTNEETHVNVQQSEYWAQKFAKNGFFNKVGFRNNIVTPWTMIFIKEADLSRVIGEYETVRRIAQKETYNVISEYEKQIKNLNETIQNQNNENIELQQKLQTQIADRSILDKKNTQLKNKVKILRKTFIDSISYKGKINKLKLNIVNIIINLEKSKLKLQELEASVKVQEDEIKVLQSEVNRYTDEIRDYDCLVWHERRLMSKLETEYKLIKNSTIWRSTKWLRTLRDFFRRK